MALITYRHQGHPRRIRGITMKVSSYELIRREAHARPFLQQYDAHFIEKTLGLLRGEAERAEIGLHALGLTDEKGALTEFGKRWAREESQADVAIEMLRKFSPEVLKIGKDAERLIEYFMRDEDGIKGYPIKSALKSAQFCLRLMQDIPEGELAPKVKSIAELHAEVKEYLGHALSTIHSLEKSLQICFDVLERTEKELQCPPAFVS
jgi:hypothetical protein